MSTPTNLSPVAVRRMPIRWRDLAFRISEPRPFRALATKCYSFAAKTCGKAFGRIDGIRAVALRGGALTGPIPAVSDIDLTLFTDELNDSQFADLVICLRHRQAKLKSKFPMLGEVLVLRPCDVELLERSGSSMLLLVNPQRVLNGEKVEIHPQAPVSSKSRIAICLHYYLQMLADAREVSGNRYPAFHRARCYRYAKKLFAACGVEEEHDSALSLPATFAKAFRAADRLITRGLAETLPPDFATLVREQRESSAEASLYTPKESFAWWLKTNQKFSGLGKLTSTADPYLFLWHGKMGLGVLEWIFERYLARLDITRRLPVVFSESMAECHPRGLTLDALDSDSQLEWSTSLGANLFFNLRDRALVHYFMLNHYLVSSSSQTIADAFRNMARAIMSMVCGKIAKDDVELISSVREKLPRACSVFEEISPLKQTHLQRSQLEGIVEATRELRIFFEKHFLVGGVTL